MLMTKHTLLTHDYDVDDERTQNDIGSVLNLNPSCPYDPISLEQFNVPVISATLVHLHCVP